MEMKIGYCQFEPEFMQKEKNLGQMVELVASAKADLIVFPELATSGYTFTDIKEVKTIAEPAKSGITTMVLKKAAWENRCSIVCGFVEEDKGKLYNSSILINPDGKSYLYRKIHLFLDEKEFFSEGDLGFVVAPAKNDVKVGMMICFDWIFPESARTLMLEGAEIIAHPANLVLPWCQQAMLTRSLENHLFTITANRTGTERNKDKSNHFTGMSQVVDPEGKRLISATESEVVCGIVTVETTRASDKHITARNEILSDRKPEYYHK